MLMLIDTPDPRYQPEPREPWHRRHPRVRICLPWVGCLTCIVAAYMVPPLITFILTVVALMLFFDGALALLPRGDGLWSNRQ